MIVEDFETDSDVLEGLRMDISVDRIQQNQIQLHPRAAQVTLTLQSSSEVANAEIEITVTSQEGLGSFQTSVDGLDQAWKSDSFRALERRVIKPVKMESKH